VFRCWVPELAHLSAQERKELAIPRHSTGEFSQCSQYVGDWTQRVPEAEANSSGRVVGSCSSGWEYDFENYHRSLVSDMDWVCEDAWIPAMSQVKLSLC